MVLHVSVHYLLSKISRVLGVTTTLFLCSCSLEGSIVSLETSTPPIHIMKASELKTFIPGGDIRMIKTAQRQYQVQATVGSVTDQIKQKSARGYTLYSSVEGSLISDSEQVQ